MLKSLKIDYYTNEYGVMHTNCIDYPIAGATGYYNYDNYFYYCFYYSVLKNWSDVKKNDGVIFTQKILDKLGLTLKLNEVKDAFELIASIKENIDSECPVVMIVKYRVLFFLITYLTNIKLNHAIVISDYDKERKFVVIRECFLNLEVTQNVMRGHPFFKLQLTEDLISDIWIKSNNFFREENSIFYNKLLSIKKISEPKITSYNDLVEDFINNYNINDSNLIQIVDRFNNNITEMKDSINIELKRRDFHGSIIILFDVFEKAFAFLTHDNDWKKKFYEFRDKYLKFRYLLLSKLHINALRDKHFNTSKKNEITDEIRNIDSELFSLVTELYLYNKQWLKVQPSGNYSKLINYALDSIATADSENNPNPDVHCKASQAVDGKWNIPEKDMWISTDFENTHWLKVDLGQPRTINKFVIRHWNALGYITVNFKIQGSNDEADWKDLVIVKDNDSGITSHDILPSTYRYFRLYITHPAQNDFFARIYEFEVWGVPK